MAKAINEEIQTNVRELIKKITHLEVGEEKFTKLEKCVSTIIRKSDTMYFLTTKDIKTAILSMAEKFMFHGFFKHAEYLKQTHDKYIDRNLSESDLTPRLHMVKFLLCMSENPTTHFWQEPDTFEFIYEKHEREEVVDWGAYLNEGLPRWSPTKDDSFQEHSESEEETDHGGDSPRGISTPRTVITENRNVEEYDFKTCRNKLMDTIQTEWYGGDVICMEPPSEWVDANVGLLWEKHLQSQAQNLVELDPLTVISEYKVMREILWQLWGPHNSTLFEWSINKLVPKSNVTISSVCSMTFEGFLDVFIPYIVLLDEFRQFYRSLEGENVAETYKSYGFSVRKIMGEVFQELLLVEEEIRLQESTMTLLLLAQKFKEIFKPVQILKIIHQEVVLGDFPNSSPIECALTLLTRLRRSLDFSLSKMEQDIRLTLYIESLFYYFAMTNAWLVKNDLFDHSGEFIIVNKNENKSQRCADFQMNFVLQENIENYCQDDGIIKIISEQVLQIGRNIHLLRLLGKYDVFSKGSETIHQEFIRRFLEELSKYYGCETNESQDVDSPKVQKIVSTFDLNQMGDWTNYVDLSDGFLAKAFDNFYTEKVEEATKRTALFEKISKITTNLFPLQNLPEKILAKILKERFTISGLMVKNLLIENYNLDKQFEFLNHIFLFWDDLIFPFYRRFFEKMSIANSNWGNNVWLTSHLQDIIMDLYPNFSENCTVQVKDFWKQCRDSLTACSLINLQYEIEWPLSIIITKERIAMYKELFQFILKLKWALHTINHLIFTDLEPKTLTKLRSKLKNFSSSRTTIKRLKYLRFNLINILNTIQHYLFGFVFAKYRLQFELDFEKSNDLKTLIKSHEDFVKSIHRSVMEVRDKNRNEHGFNAMLKCVKLLKVMWNGAEYATVENLENCHRMYRDSFQVVNEIVNPVFFFDY